MSTALRPDADLAELGGGPAPDPYLEGIAARAEQPAPTEPLPPKRSKGSYIGAPACYALELALKHVCAAYRVGACYQVGSSLERPDWRDVDIRLILDDAEFARQFPDAHPTAHEIDPKWLLTTVTISAWLSQQSGLPVDFQIQSRTHANTRHKGPRNARGIRLDPLTPLDD